MSKISQVKIYQNGKLTPVADRGMLFNFDSDGEYIVLPGLVDIHVHLREPGFSFKEDISSGTLSAARGGYSAVCSMPNLKPVPDSVENVKLQLSIIEKNAKVRVYPYGSITVNEEGKTLSDMEGLAPFVIAFSDDGKGVDDDGLMTEAMQRAKALNKIITAHCEDKRLIGGCINDCEYALKHALKPLPKRAEWQQLARDLDLVSKTGVKYHACHLSAKESVELIRQAKKSGLDVTCETAPHYLTLTDENLRDEGRFKMNPPLGSRADKDALIEGVVDGTIDVLATDHAPHTAEEKSRGLEKSLFGIVGLETAFPIIYTHLVKKSVISLERLVELMCINPAQRFGIDNPMDKNYSIFEVGKQYKINSAEFLSKGRSTPFEGEMVFGRCIKTVINGGEAWREN